METVPGLNQTPGRASLLCRPCGIVLSSSGPGCYLTENFTRLGLGTKCLLVKDSQLSPGPGMTTRTFLLAKHNALQGYIRRGRLKDMWDPDMTGRTHDRFLDYSKLIFGVSKGGNFPKMYASKL